jgi:TonB family protein
LFRPTVALPSRFEALASGFQRAVICHELVHIKRRDIPVALAEELAVAALWFHPWVWLLRGEIRIAREQAVDARVIELLGNPDGYVRCLVDISGHDLAPHMAGAGAGMLRQHELRARVDAIFQEARMSKRRLVFVMLALMMLAGAPTYLAAVALPMRPPKPIDRASSNLAQTMVQQAGLPAANTLDPAITGPLSMAFKDARLRDVLAFIGHATSVVFTGYEASFDEGRSVTIATTAELEPLLDQLLTPNGLMYTVTGPRTVAIARRPQAEARQATRSQTTPGAPRKQINTVYPEYPQDALKRGIQGTVIVDITVNAEGDVTTAAVASGPQDLRASAFTAALALKYTPSASTTATKVAFRYTVTANSWSVRIDDVLTNGGANWSATRSSSAAPDQDRPPNPDASGAYRIGGDMQPPKKLKDIAPQYPPLAQQARVQGVVILEARIDENGDVSDARPLRSIPLLDQAAIDAVKQWQYTPTLLNGVAVPVTMTVTVNFSLRELISLQIILPDGTSGNVELASGGLVQVPGVRFHLRPSRARGSDDVTVEVLVDDGQTHLGEMVLTLNGPVVQSPTTPSFGIRLLGIR